MSRWPLVPPVVLTRAWQLAVCLDEYVRTGSPYWRDEAIHFARDLSTGIPHTVSRLVTEGRRLP